MDARFLLPFLQEQNVLSEEQAREIQDELSRTGKPVEALLGNFGIIQMPQILEKISDSLGLPLLADLSGLDLSPEVLARIPPHTARNLGALPVAGDETTLTVALADPLAVQALEDLRFATGREIAQVVAPRIRFSRFWTSITDRRRSILTMCSRSWKTLPRALWFPRGWI